jgi:cell division protein FtsQ
MIKQELELLAWVDVATVKRQWPDKVVVRLVEHEPIAFWGDEGMINSRGELFFPELTTSKYGNLPVFIGPDGTSANMMKAFIKMNTSIENSEEKITHLEMNARRAWKVELKNGLRMQLGRENITQRFTRFKDVYELTVSKYIDVIELIDLRYTNGFAVQWREGAQPEITG